jgi:HrpA-like RNA helicase
LNDTIQEPGGVLVFLPGQDDIEALESLLEENLPDIVGQQSQEFLGSHDEKSNGEVTGSKAEPVVRKGILKDFEIRPLYAAMPPEEQVRCSSMI